MRRALAVVAALALALAAGSGAASRLPGAFVVIGDSSPALPGPEHPNSPDSLALPPDWTVRAAAAASAPAFGDLQAIWERAGAAYGIPWPLLAAINKIETNFGRNMGPSSAGAVGWMQFMPDTWLRWGVDASGDGVADPWNAEDAVHAAARYLAAAGGASDLQRAVFAYNHAQWYVDEVLALAQTYGLEGVALTTGPDPAAVAAAERRVAELRGRLDEAAARERVLRGREDRLLARATASELLSARLEARKVAVQAGIRTAEATSEVEQLRAELEAAEQRLESARAGDVSTGLGALLPAGAADGYVFPVGGGPGMVSVGRTHHDYPAADIAAPLGSPVYALADAQVVDAYPFPAGRCGIGATIRTGDGLTWTYCHLAVLDGGVQPGAVLAAGAPLGLVGSTGRSTGPHLHLQLQPALAYPQELAWFQAFAGRAFAWQGDERPQAAAAAPAPPARAHPVFAVVDEELPSDEVVEFVPRSGDTAD